MQSIQEQLQDANRVVWMAERDIESALRAFPEGPFKRTLCARRQKNNSYLANILQAACSAVGGCCGRGCGCCTRPRNSKRLNHFAHCTSMYKCCEGARGFKIGPLNPKEDPMSTLRLEGQIWEDGNVPLWKIWSMLISGDSRTCFYFLPFFFFLVFFTLAKTLLAMLLYLWTIVWHNTSSWCLCKKQIKIGKAWYRSLVSGPAPDFSGFVLQSIAIRSKCLYRRPGQAVFSQGGLAGINPLALTYLTKLLALMDLTTKTTTIRRG